MNPEELELLKARDGQEYFSMPMSFRGSIVDNKFTAKATAIGELARSGKCFFPGAFSRGVLSSFVTTGFIADGHDWFTFGNILADVDSCTVAGKELSITASFHETENAQNVRSIMAKRLDSGKDVGVSIGCITNWEKVAFFDSGDKLLAYADGLGCDMSLFDAGISKHKGWCMGIPEVKEILETSVVPIQDFRSAKARSVSSFLGDLSDGSRADMSFENHLGAVLAAVEGVLDRAKKVQSTREQEGRTIGPQRVQQIKTLASCLSLLASDSNPVPTRDHARELMARKLELENLLLGVAPC